MNTELETGLEDVGTEFDDATWRRILRLIPIRGAAPTPPAESTLRRFEKRTGILLPESYRDFCRVFGAGQVCGHIEIAVPGYRKPRYWWYSLKELNERLHRELPCRPKRGPFMRDARKYDRSVVFAISDVRDVFFWDPTEPSNDSPLEFPIYSSHTAWGWSTGFVANSFSEFFVSFVLKSDNGRVDLPPMSHFWPAP